MLSSHTHFNHTIGENSNSGTLAKQANVLAQINDVIVVTKEGQLTYRDSMKTSKGEIRIEMIPSAGNATDADGNVYQTVMIGNQVWTVENLRTTKYNDKTPIPHIPDDSAWLNLSTPGYSFYSNVSIPADQMIEFNDHEFY